MRIYAAAVYQNGYRGGGLSARRQTPEESTAIEGCQHLLESFHYIHKGPVVEKLRKDGTKIFLDSGAFSAFTLKKSIDLGDYCDFIHRNRDIIREDDGVLVASVLDGIGDAQLTYENQLEMERRGAAPLPCFHYGEDPRYLEWYVRKYPYIALGGMAKTKRPLVQDWLDEMWEKFLVDGSGRPRCKVHAFGVTSESITQRYPWWSVDSSSWIQYALFGAIMTMQFGIVATSNQSAKRHEEGRHLTTLTPIEQEAVKEEIAYCGFDFGRLQERHETRAAYNLGVYAKWLDVLRLTAQYTRTQPGIF